MTRLGAVGLTLAAMTAASTLGGCGFLVVGGVTAAAIVGQDRRTTGTVVDDQGIEFRAASELRKNEELDEQAHINVTSFNQVVLLTGETPTEEMRTEAERIVGGIENVDRVFNELIIAPPSTFSSRSGDAWITTSVRTQLIQLNSPEFDPGRVKVTTSRGTVYLMGILYPDEVEPVTEVVRRVNGVQRVVRLFEFRTREDQPSKTEPLPESQPPGPQST